jgi:aminoglycoside 3-N-acetyltransferase
MKDMSRPTPFIGQEEIANALKEVGVATGQTLLVHSFLGAFGVIEGGMNAILSALKAAVGLIDTPPAGTLIFPTYNYDFCKGAPYDHEETPSQVGQLTEFVRHQSEAKRAFHPVYSHAVIGVKQSYYCQNPGKSGFGKGSFFERLYRDPEAHLLFFGVDWNSATFIHHVEESLKVPYRFVKIFRGSVIYEGKKEEYTAEIFSRYLDLGIVIELKPLQKFMLETGENTQARLGRGVISRVHVADFFRRAVEQYEKNPFYFLAAPVDVSQVKEEGTTHA